MDDTLLRSLAPALAFLCVAVPLAALLERVGFFDAVATVIEQRWTEIPVGVLWLVAAMTTAVLNLDTTIVLLTPLYVRLARRGGIDPFGLALVPLLVACLASSILPVSNLTTIVAVERFDLSFVDVVVHLAPASLVATAIGWVVYRRRWTRTMPSGRAVSPAPAARRALAIGAVSIVVLLVGFVLGPAVGIDPWVVVLVVDVALVAVTRSIPWRQVPLAVAGGVFAIALVVDALPADLVPTFRAGGAWAAALVTFLGAGVANVCNNLPALFVALDRAHLSRWGLWSWLTGINVGAVLLPIGALSNLLWWRIVRAEGIELSLRRYVGGVVPIASWALAGAVTCVALQQVVSSR